MIVIAPAAALGIAAERTDGIFGDRDTATGGDAPRAMPGGGLFGRLGTDTPLTPATVRPRPPRPARPRRI